MTMPFTGSEMSTAVDPRGNAPAPADPARVVRHRLAVVDSHVIQYHGPLYRLLAAEPSIDLTVLYCSDQGAVHYRDRDMGTTLRWDLDLLDGYRHRFLPNLGWGNGFLRLINPTLALGELSHRRYDAVLFMTGWAWLSAWIGFGACHMGGPPIILFGDSSFVTPERSIRQRLRARIIRSLFRVTRGFMISGKLNGDYYVHYGADRRRFFPMPWAIDNDRFLEGSRFAAGERATLRESLGFREEDVVFVYSGKLIARKDPMALLDAIHRMRYRDRAALLFLGDGVLREELERFAKEAHLRVRFEGFVNQAALPKMYAAGDAFVLPSHFDPRATVVNEAMACGLPIVITDRCGPSADLVRPGENGFVFTPGDSAQLAKHLDTLAGDSAMRDAMGARSREILRTWSYREDVAGILQALDAVASNRENRDAS